MNIIIVGCGKIGKILLSSLAKENHNLTAIDSNEDVVRDIRNSYDVIALCGNSTSYSVLKEAGVEACDLFIASTSSDEMNMLSCFAAKRMGAKYTVARIRNPENNDSIDFVKELLELSMTINPELLTAQTIYNLLKLPAATKLETFGSNQLEMIEMIVRPNSPLDGVPLKEIRKKNKSRFLICAVMRGGEVFIPNGDFALASGDHVGLIVAEGDLNSVLDIFGVPHTKIKNVMIVGAGITSKYLAKILLSHRIQVKIVERDAAICEEVCEELPSKATVIHGDATNQDLLDEEGLSATDALISLTDMDEKNILISFYGVAQSVHKVIAKVNRDEMYQVAEKLGLDSLISPRKVTADLIVKYARALENTLDSHIETLYSLMSGMAEALEFKVLSTSRCTDTPLKEMKLKKGVLVAGIIRGKEAIIPSGDDTILPEDKVIIISAGVQIHELSDILA